MSGHKSSIFSTAILGKSIPKAFFMLNPMHLIYNPIMFTVFIASCITTLLWIQAFMGKGEGEPAWFIGSVSAWLWFTLIFANFSEALAENRGKAQAEALKASRTETLAKKLIEPTKNSKFKVIPSTFLKEGRLCVGRNNEVIPVDGEVIDGIASVDESAVTGEARL